MKISAKQDSIAQAVADGYKEILLEGAIGTSKTYGAALLLLGLALDYPGSRIFVGRRHLTEIRTSTLPSFEEAAGDMGLIEEKNYTITRGVPPTLKLFTDGLPSYIFFIGIDHIKDPQFIKLKGLSATCAYIDEADGVAELGFTTLASRTGRVNKNGAPDFTLLSCNANDGWIKRRFYDKYKDPAKNGRLSTNQCVVEFDVTDSFLPASYYSKFDNNPVQWQLRYLKNDWNYGDDEGSLFKYRFLDALHVNEFAPGFKSIGYDVARQGKDRSVCSLWEGGVLADIAIVKDFDEQMDGGEQAKWLHAYATRRQVGYQDIGVDGVGNGVTVIDNLKTLFGWRVKPFIAGAVPEAKKRQEARAKQFTDTEIEPMIYNNLRSEQTYLLSADTERGGVHFYDGCPYLTDFKKEATMHNYDTKDKMLIVEPKDRVKQRTGHSPDVFDSVLIGYYMQGGAKTTTSSYKDLRGKADQPTRLSTKGRPKTAGLWKKQF